jgi:hypothetical protein
MNHLALQLDDGQCRMLVSIKLDESKTAVGLHPDFREIADRLEEGNKVGLRAVWDEIADIDSRVVRGSLLDDGFI